MDASQPGAGAALQLRVGAFVLATCTDAAFLRDRGRAFASAVAVSADAATIARVSIALGARGSAKLQTLTALEIEDFLGAVS